MIRTLCLKTVLPGMVVFAVLLSGIACTSTSIPYTVETLLPPEEKPLSYTGLSPWRYGTYLFSDFDSRDLRWQQSRGTWVLWNGVVEDLRPAIDPDQAICLFKYQTAAFTFDSGQFAVVLISDSKTIASVNKGDAIWFRGKLDRMGTDLMRFSRYGDVNNYLELESVTLVPGSDIAVMLALAGYTTTAHLDRLASADETIENLGSYFQYRAGLSKDAVYNLAQFGLKLLNIELRDNPPAVDHNASNILALQMAIEESLAGALVRLHTGQASDTPTYGNVSQAIANNNKIVDSIAEGTLLMQHIYEGYQRPSNKTFSDLIREGVLQLADYAIPGIGDLIGVSEAGSGVIQELWQFSDFEQMVITCQTWRHLIDLAVTQVSDNTLELMEKVG